MRKRILFLVLLVSFMCGFSQRNRFSPSIFSVTKVGSTIRFAHTDSTITSVPCQSVEYIIKTQVPSKVVSVFVINTDGSQKVLSFDYSVCGFSTQQSAVDSLSGWSVCVDSTIGGIYFQALNDSAGDIREYIDNNIFIDNSGVVVNHYNVLNSLNTPTVSPVTGDVYLVGNSPTGVFAGHAKDIAEWDSSAWVFTDGVQGDFLYNATSVLTYIYRSGNWVQTTGIPALNNGNSISSGLKIGTNNAKSLTFETNNINRGRIDSIGRFHVYNLPISTDTFVGVTDINGKFGKIGKSTFLSDVSGGVSENIYNSNGLITDSVRDVYTTSMLNFMDTANRTYSSIGGAVFPNPLTGELTYIPSLPGIYNSKYFWTPNVSQFILASNKVDEDMSRFNVGSEIFDLNNNIIVGGKGSYDKSDSDYYYRLFYKHPDNESLWLTLGNKNPDRRGFFLTPFEYSGDVVGIRDKWKQPYTLRIADTTDHVFFGTKTRGEVFLVAPPNNSVTSLVGWNSLDSTLAFVDKSSIGSGETLIELGTITYADVNAGSASVTIEIPLTTNQFPANSYITSVFTNATEAFYSSTDSPPNVNANTGGSTYVTTLGAVESRSYDSKDADYAIFGATPGGAFYPQLKQAAFTINAMLSFNTVNPQDYTAGSVTYYVTVKQFPF